MINEMDRKTETFALPACCNSTKQPSPGSIASDERPGFSAIRTWRKRALTAARAIFQRTTHEQPDYAQAWTYLGLTDAMLGRRDEAIQEGKRDFRPSDSTDGRAGCSAIVAITSDETRDGLPSLQRKCRGTSHKLFRLRSRFPPPSLDHWLLRQLLPTKKPARLMAWAVTV